jgi:hypothetical protein
MVLPSDRLAIQTCIKTSNLEDRGQARIVRIHNTGSLTEIEVSENMAGELKNDRRFEILSEPRELPFDREGNLF